MSQDPTSIGRYQIQRVLGQGAMGTVYLAMDPLLKRLVAIKVIHAKGSDLQQTLERFQREAEISARLNHPNVVTVYDVGTDALMGPFMAMEFVDGTSLSKLIRIGLSVEAGMRLLVQGMGALKAAHDSGIVHRDIKPDNILVSHDGRFKLMDFGIARRDESHLTQAGMIFGTPSFTAPELLTGGEASRSSDCYAFAVTAFEVVTGRLPYTGSSVGSTLYRIVHDPPTFPVGTRSYVEDVFRKALAKKPAERFPDLPSFMAALVEALDFGEEVKLKLLAYITGDQPFPPTQPMDRGIPVVRPVSGAIDATEMLQAPRATGAFGEVLPTVMTIREAPAPEPLEESPATQLMPLEAKAPGTVLMPSEAPVEPLVVMSTEPTGAQPTMLMPAEEAPPPDPVRETRPKPPIPAPAPAKVPATASLAAGRGLPSSRWIWISVAAVVLVGGGLAVFLGRRGPSELRIQVNPVGAKVLVDGAHVGSAPVQVRVARGEEPLVQVAQEGFLSQEQRASRGQTEMRFTLERKSVSTGSTVDVLTDPDGAEVFLDGTSMGHTPLKGLALPKDGTPKLELRREGYEVHSMQVDKDMPFPEMITLTPLRRGRR